MAATSEDGNDIEITDNVLQRDGVIVPSFPHEDYQIDTKENSHVVDDNRHIHKQTSNISSHVDHKALIEVLDKYPLLNLLTNILGVRGRSWSSLTRFYTIIAVLCFGVIMSLISVIEYSTVGYKYKCFTTDARDNYCDFIGWVVVVEVVNLSRFMTFIPTIYYIRRRLVYILTH